MSENIQKGAVASVLIHTSDSAGEAVNATSISVTNVYVNAVAASTAGFTVPQAKDETPANVMGAYFLQFPTAAYAKGAQIDATVSATIGGIVVSKTYSFVIVDDPVQRPRLV